jgi:citron Rho-interacting kinase
LYEECHNIKAKNRSQQISSFIATFQNVVHNFSKLRSVNPQYDLKTASDVLRVNIGDFKVIRVIGRGNFADVQLARERGSGKVYALKVMKKVGENVPAYYCEERDIMATNSSPWLTKLDYAFQDSGHLYLAMEFHCGGDLLSLLDRHGNCLDEASVRFYTAEVALGIHDLHKMGFVHRDIKPENILIDRTGHLKLADFGNAARLSTAGTVNKVMTQIRKYTNTQIHMQVMPVGTPDYIAPEVLQCLQSGEDSHGTDCDYWSLGGKIQLQLAILTNVIL